MLSACLRGQETKFSSTYTSVFENVSATSRSPQTQPQPDSQLPRTPQRRRQHGNQVFDNMTRDAATRDQSERRAGGKDKWSGHSDLREIACRSGPAEESPDTAGSDVSHYC